MSGTISSRIILALQFLVLGVVGVTSAAFISPSHQFPIFDMYFAGLMVVCLALSTFSSWKVLSSPQLRSLPWPKWEVVSVLAITFIAAVVRFYGLGQYDTWFDEDLQVGHLLRWNDPMSAAIGSIQSPIDYYLSLFSLNTLGVNFVAMRFFPALFGTLTIPAVYCVCRNYTRAGVATLIALVCMFHPWILAYGREGRPYAGALFFFILLLQWLWWASQDNSKRSVWLGVFALEVVFFYYLSILPITIALVLGFCFFLFRKQLVGFVKRYAVVTVAAIVLWLPIFILITIEESGEFRRNSLTELIQEGKLFAEVMFGMYGPSIIGLGVIAYALYRRRDNIFVSALLLFSLIYPVCLFVGAKPMFPYSISERYMVTYICVYFVGLGFALHALEPQKHARAYRAAVGVVLLALAFFYVDIPSKKLAQPYWVEAFEWMEKNKQEGLEVAAIFSPAGADEHEYAGFIGVDFYLNAMKKYSVKASSNWDINVRQTAALIQLLQKYPKPQKIYLLSYNREHASFWQTLPLRDLPFVRVETLPSQAAVIEINTSTQALETLILFFEVAQVHEQREKFQWRYDQVLLGLRALQGNCSGAEKHERALHHTFRRRSEKRNQEFLQELLDSVCSNAKASS